VTDEEFDDALDGMPAAKRKKVLRLVGDEERAPPKKIPTSVKFGRTLAVMFAFIWSIPFTVIGMLLTISVVLAPVGVPLMFIGAWPLYRCVKRWVRMSVEDQTE
jgi:hypothetical protein